MQESRGRTRGFQRFESLFTSTCRQYKCHGAAVRGQYQAGARLCGTAPSARAVIDAVSHLDQIIDRSSTDNLFQLSRCRYLSAGRFLICVIYLAPVAGWGPYNLHGIGHVSWVGSGSERCCTTSQDGRLCPRCSR